MIDLISRRAVVECVYKALRTPPLKGVFTDTMSLAISMVNDLPSAQPERKKGKWILTEDDNYEYCTCSECGYQNGENWMNGSDIPFCAVCGADMRGEQDDSISD